MVERTAKLSLKEQLKKIPEKNGLHADRYDTDLHHVLHVWDSEIEESYDIVSRKEPTEHAPTIQDFSTEELIAELKSREGKRTGITINEIPHLTTFYNSNGEQQVGGATVITYVPPGS